MQCANNTGVVAYVVVLIPFEVYRMYRLSGTLFLGDYPKRTRSSRLLVVGYWLGGGTICICVILIEDTYRK